MQRITRKETRFVGLDVHAETIAVAIATKDGDVHTLGSIPNRPESIKRLVTRRGRRDTRCTGSWPSWEEPAR